MSKKIHFNSFDLPVVDKTVLPHMVYNLNGNEYYVKTKKAESSDKKIGVGCLKFNNYEWLIKNSWGKLLPADCTSYMQNNYTNTFQTITVLPDELQNADASNVTNMSCMFYCCKSLTTIPQLDTSKVTNMNEMFSDCKSLTTIPLLDTSKVTNMVSMFSSCISLTTIQQLLDTSKITNMNDMFSGCKSLTAIPQLNTSNVTNMNWMFSDCESLTSIQQLDTSKVTNMSGMFSGCKNLTTIPQLDTSKVTNMNWMVSNCSKLTSIPKLDTSKVTNMWGMFSGCTSLPATFEWVIDCSSITTIIDYINDIGIQDIFKGSSVKEVTFKNVKESIKADFTAANLGSQLTKITIESTIA